MQIITEPQTIQQACLRWRADGVHTALVPTMGYYHAGHESLMAHARAVSEKVIVSLFVNPAQFGPGEDFAAYPRDLERDAAMAEAQGVDVLFAPKAEDLYKKDHATWVEVPALSQTMCGLSRPTHFRGVCTVVTKLLMLTMPRIAVFGQKDWQQVAVIRRMVRDLNIPVDIVGRPIVREPDGLAMSSRNIYLTAEERLQAPHIHHGLALGRAITQSGERDAETIKIAIRRYWAQNLPGGEEDYLTIVDPVSLEPVDRLTGATLCATAVRVGQARLLDNMMLLGD